MSTEDWFSNYVNFAKSEGIISGYASVFLGDSVKFKPNKKISFSEASTIIVNVLINNKTELKDFIDVKNFEMDSDLTRGKMAELIYELKDFVQ